MGEVFCGHKAYSFASNGIIDTTGYQADSDTIDVSGQIDAAATAGRYLIVTLKPSDDTDFSYLVNPVIKIISTQQDPAPTISGTHAEPMFTAGTTDAPFSHVTLTDPGNLDGTGDEIQISVLNTSNVDHSSSDDFGTLSGTGLASYGAGSYTLTAGSLAALQTELQALIFTSTRFTGTADAHLALELDLQSISGRVADDQSTTLDINPGFVAAPAVTLASFPTADNANTAVLGSATAVASGDVLTVTLTSDADFANGSNLVLNNGSLVYTPGLVTAATVGSDTLHYTVRDTTNGSTTQ